MNANGESLIRDTDLLFLRGIVESPVIDKLKENTVQNSAKPLITNIRFVFGLSPNPYSVCPRLRVRSPVDQPL